jgi:hypothetical protein
MPKYDKKFASFTGVDNGFHASVRISMIESLMQKNCPSLFTPIYWNDCGRLRADIFTAQVNYPPPI